jgi:hypothetical protein
MLCSFTAESARDQQTAPKDVWLLHVHLPVTKFICCMRLFQGMYKKRGTSSTGAKMKSPSSSEELVLPVAEDTFPPGLALWELCGAAEEAEPSQS